MKIEILSRLLIRLSRKQNATIIWYVRNVNDVRKTIDEIADYFGLNDYPDVSISHRSITIGTNKIIFVTDNTNPDKLLGIDIDEAIIDG